MRAMILANPVAVVAVLAVGGSTVAQENADAQRVAELIEQLEDADALQRDTAMHKLVELGRPAAEALGRQLSENETVDLAVVRTLGKMGPDAIDSLDTLLDLFVDTEDLKAQTALGYAALGILPFAAEKEQLVSDIMELEAQGSRAARQTSGEVQARAASASKLLFVMLLNSMYCLGLARERTTFHEIFEQVSESRVSGPEHCVGVVHMLGRSGPDADSVREMLQTVLLDSGPSVASETMVPFAEAILRLDPSSEEAVEAHAYLAQHGDTYQKYMAATALREFGDSSGRAAGSVTAALQSSGLHPRVAIELIVTAGIIGSFADREARETLANALTELAELDDAQVAERAKAALRQLRGR